MLNNHTHCQATPAIFNPKPVKEYGCPTTRPEIKHKHILYENISDMQSHLPNPLRKPSEEFLLYK